MKLTKDQVCVYIENEAQLQEARGLLEKYNQKEWDYFGAFIMDNECDYLVYSYTDDDWFMGNCITDEQKITLQELETILKEQL